MFTFRRANRVKRYIDQRGLTHLDAPVKIMHFGELECFTEFRAALELSGLIPAEARRIQLVNYDEVYIAIPFVEKILRSNPRIVMIRFANGAWGVIPSKVFEGWVESEPSLVEEHPLKVAISIYRKIAADLEYGGRVLSKVTMLRGHHISFTTEGLLGNAKYLKRTPKQIIDHFTESHSLRTSWGIRQPNAACWELCVVMMMVGQSHAGHTIARIIPEDFLGMLRYGSNKT